MTDEKRRFKRYDVVGIEGTLLLHLDAKVIDLSLTGMSIETTTPMKPGTSYTVKLVHDSADLRLTATARWCRLERTEHNAKGESVGIYRAGLDFRNSLDEKARWLLDYIERHIVLELEGCRRIAGRFTIFGDGDIYLGTSGEFVARRLSLGGMLVESGIRPEPGALLEIEARHQARPFTARARVVSSEPVGGVETSGLLGLAFEPLSAEAETAIAAIIEDAL